MKSLHPNTGAVNAATTLNPYAARCRRLAATPEGLPATTARAHREAEGPLLPSAAWHYSNVERCEKCVPGNTHAEKVNKVSWSVVPATEEFPRGHSEACFGPPHSVL